MRLGTLHELRSTHGVADPHDYVCSVIVYRHAESSHLDGDYKQQALVLYPGWNSTMKWKTTLVHFV